jgi:DNA mismatch endonuclease (patch repair protein)
LNERILDVNTGRSLEKFFVGFGQNEVITLVERSEARSMRLVVRMTRVLDKARSAQMAQVKSRDTKPEMLVRRALHACGLRYRLHAKDLPGKPDLVFRSRRVVVFVHGCFWHQHPDPACKLARMPKSRLDFWRPKLEGNRRRDERVREQLEALGWSVVEVWECQTRAQELQALAEWMRQMPTAKAPRKKRGVPRSEQ